MAREASRRIPLARTGRELRGLADLALEGWRSGRRPWLGAALAAGTCVAAGLQAWSRTAPLVRAAADVRADQPLPLELARLPLSALVPTADLPLWLAAGQLLLVVGLVELRYSRRLLVAVAAVGHLLPTLAARVMTSLPAGNPLALPASYAHELDTGPSALTTALGGFLLISTGSRRVAVALAVALLAADRWSPGLDGREHLLALGVGVVAGALHRRHARGPRPAAPALPVTRAAAVLGLTVLAVLAVDAYHPIDALAAGASAPAPAALRLQDRAGLPIELDRLPAGTWLAAGPRCGPPHRGSAGSVWRRPRYLCSAVARTVVLHYRVAGVPETQRVRLG